MTDSFKQECKKYANQNRLGKIEYGDNQVISYSDYLQSLTIDESCIVNGSILGAIYSKNCKFNTLDNYELTNDTFNALIGVKYADSSEEYINMGKYTIQKPTNDKTAKTGEFEGLDDLSKLETTDYICSYNDFTNITIKDILTDICNQAGLVLGTTAFTNDDIPITGNPFTNNEKCIDVLKAILKVSLNFAYIDNDDNKLYLKWVDTEVSDTLTKSDYTTLEKNNIYGPINCLVLRMSSFEGENVVRQDDASIALNGENQFIIEDDYFLITEELREQYIDALWDKIKGFTYIDCKIISYTGKPYLRVGSKISVQDDDDTYFNTYVLKHNFKYDGTFYSVIESPALTKEEEKRKNNQSLKNFRRNVQAIVDKAVGDINLLVEQVTEQVQSVAYIEEQIQNLNVSIEGLTNTLTKTGGGNLIKDSLGALNDGDWTNQVSTIRDTYTLENSIAGQGIMLNSSTIEQQIQLPNEVHTLSFKYKKNLSTANVKLYLNDTEYVLDQTNTTEFSQQITISNNTLNVKFVSDTDNSCYILDLLLNLGETKDTWTQNANETVTNTVKIGQGIQVENSNINTYWRADADGSRVFNKTTDEVVQEATDKGTVTNELTSRSTSIINGVLFAKVGSHRWISGV